MVLPMNTRFCWQVAKKKSLLLALLMKVCKRLFPMTLAIDSQANPRCDTAMAALGLTVCQSVNYK